jgi:tetratricopeptide (TPR) repeat protein
LRQYPELALAKGEPRDRDPADTVAATWRVSLDQVRPVPGALSLLEVCAFLAPDDIPRELFTVRVDEQPEELAALVADPFALDEAVAALRRYGLAKASQEILIVHRLLQQVVRDSLSAEMAVDRAGLTIQLLEAVFPSEGLTDFQGWPVCERLLLHVLAATEHAERLAAQPESTGRLLDHAATYLQGRGRYAEAKSLFERAVAVTEQAFGPKDMRTAFRLNNLGLLLHWAGDYPAAKVTLERSLAIKQAAPDSDRLSVAFAFHNLGTLLGDLGDLDGARDHLQRALNIREAALDRNDPNIANTLHNLGTVLQKLGDLDGARDHLQRDLAISETAWGPDHPVTRVIAQNLAGL